MRKCARRGKETPTCCGLMGYLPLPSFEVQTTRHAEIRYETPPTGVRLAQVSMPPIIALLLAAALYATATAQSPPALLTRGISQPLARHRAATVHDVRYDLTLDVTGLDSAVGRVTIRFRRSDSGDAIVDFRGR